jgi:flagellar motor switch protein FliM
METELETKFRLSMLHLSDIVSSELKLIFSLDFQELAVIPYQQFIQKLDRKYLTFSTEDSKKKKIIHVLDANIIYALNNRMFGGEGIVERRDFDTLFSFSEQHMATLFRRWVIEAFEQEKISFKIKKRVENPRFYHLFLPDEDVVELTFAIKITKAQIGMYYCCVEKSMFDDAGIDLSEYKPAIAVPRKTVAKKPAVKKISVKKSSTSKLASKVSKKTPVKKIVKPKTTKPSADKKKK